MGDKRRFTLADVRRSYTPEKARDEWYTDWVSALLYRPLSFPIATILLAFGVSANSVTLASILSAFALPVLAAWFGPKAQLWVGAAAMVWVVFDCVDGNIARVTGTMSRLGSYLDLTGDLLFRICLYAAIGIFADFTPIGPLREGLAIALAAALFSTLARLCRVRVREMTGTNVYKPNPKTNEPVRKGVMAQIVLPFFNGIERLLPLVLIVSTAWSALLWAILLWLLIYSAADFVYSQIRILRTLSQL